MKHIIRLSAVALNGVLIGLLFFGSTASAFSVGAGRVLDDSIMDNYTSMTASQINNFLNGFPNSCISPNNGFLARDVNGYSDSTGYTYGGNATAGTIIAHAAQAYEINPQVLLATLQKEQSLVSGGGGCSTSRYVGAMGYGCPDSGTTHSYTGLNLYTKNGVTYTSTGNTCVNNSSKAGFSQQLIRGAWLLKFGQQRSKGNINWAIIKTTTTDTSGLAWSSNWDNSDDLGSCYGGPMLQGYHQTCPSGPTTYYDGYRTIDGTPTKMLTGATASLYWYTPHFSGNQSFENIFQSWFGPATTSGFEWQYLGQNQYTDSTKTTVANANNMLAGTRYYVTVQLKNTGTQTWKKGVVNLGTNGPKDRSSVFYDNTWPSRNRAAVLDQASVAPGGTGSFSFWVKAPLNGIGTYREYFVPVADGYSWMTDYGLYWQFKVQPRQYTWQYQGQNAYTDQTKATPVNLSNVTPGQRYYLTVNLKNTGNMTWAKGAVNLGTSQHRDRSSVFYDNTWPSRNRAAVLDQASVAPGGTGSFSFWVRVPLNQGGDFKEYFSPVADTADGGWLADYGMHWRFNVPNPQYTWQYQGQNAYTDQTKATPVNLSNVTPGQRIYLSAQVKNTGNVLWYPRAVNLGTSGPVNRSSAFKDNTWYSSNRPATIAANTLPGQSTTFDFWVTAPSNPGTYKEYFAPVADNVTWFADYGLYWQFTVQ